MSRFTQKVAPPARLAQHHQHNILPAGHTRDDYDFDYADGVWGPIRVSTQNAPEIFLDGTALVWCRRHGWEREIIPDGDVFSVNTDGVKVWGWSCPFCTRTRHEKRFTKISAEGSLADHIRTKHPSTPIPYRLRVPKEPDPAVCGSGGPDTTGAQP